MVVNSNYHKVLNFRLSYESSEVITLKPGVNALDPKQVDALKKNTIFQMLHTQNLVEVVEPLPPPKRKKSPKKVKVEKVEF